MPFQRLLTELVQHTEGAEGAIMAAYDGEAVAEYIAPDSQIDAYGIKLIGAGMRVLLAKLDRHHQQVDIEHLRELSIRSERLTFFVHILQEEYFVTLAVRNGPGLVGARERLQQISSAILREM